MTTRSERGLSDGTWIGFWISLDIFCSPLHHEGLTSTGFDAMSDLKVSLNLSPSFLSPFRSEFISFFSHLVSCTLSLTALHLFLSFSLAVPYTSFFCLTLFLPTPSGPRFFSTFPSSSTSPRIPPAVFLLPSGPFPGPAALLPLDPADALCAA